MPGDHVVLGSVQHDPLKERLLQHRQVKPGLLVRTWTQCTQ